MYTDRHRLAYQLFCVALLAVNIAVGLGAELDLPDVPKDLWCTDITEYVSVIFWKKYKYLYNN